MANNKNKKTKKTASKLKKTELENQTEDNILVFCAHSDDQILGPGGTLAKYAREGKKIYTYVFSYGEKSHPWLKDKVTIEMRVKEAQKADKVIGGQGVVFFGLEEGRFFEHYKTLALNQKIVNIIKEKKPSKIFTHSTDDPHPDHRATAKIILSLLENIGYECDVYTFDVWTAVKYKERDSPILFVDITKTFKTKLKALKCFKSQKIAILTLISTVYLRGLLNGLRSGHVVAERFVKVR